MSRRIHDPCGPIAPELVLYGNQDSSAAGDRSLYCLIYVLDIDKDHDG